MIKISSLFIYSVSDERIKKYGRHSKRYLSKRLTQFLNHNHKPVNKMWERFVHNNCSTVNETENDSSIIQQFMFHYGCFRFIKYC